MRMCVILLLVLVAGCTPALTDYRQITPIPRNDIRTPLIPAALGRVTLGYRPQSPESGAYLLAALQETLRTSGVFSPSAPYLLHVELTELLIDSDPVAVTFSARVKGTYVIKDSSGLPIFRKSILSIGSSGFDESPLGVDRHEFAIRKAIAGNLAGFRDELIVSLAELREAIMRQNIERSKPKAPTIQPEERES